MQGGGLQAGFCQKSGLAFGEHSGPPQGCRPSLCLGTRNGFKRIAKNGPHACLYQTDSELADRDLFAEAWIKVG